MTRKVPITFACGPHDRMDPLAHGEVQPADINLNYITIENLRDIFDRMIKAMEFDVSEMSSSEYICRYAAGHRDLIAIPVFPSRAFRHSCVVVDNHRIKKASDLNGKRVGVQLYTMTAAVWIRGFLQEAGVHLSSITWVEGDMRKPGRHGSNAPPPLCKPIKRIHNEDKTRGLSDLLVDGELAATIGAEPAPCLGQAPNLQHLFPDIRLAENDYYRTTRIFPIMHLVVIKKAVVAKYPFVPSSLFLAMQDSKEVALRRMKYRGSYRYMLPFLASDLVEIDELFGGDPWPYGLEPNRKTLEALVVYLYDQGMIAEKIPIEELFAPLHG